MVNYCNREKVLERDGNKCVKCGWHLNITVHHIIPMSVDPTLKSKMDNMITLCKNCHKKEHQQDKNGPMSKTKLKKIKRKIYKKTVKKYGYYMQNTKYNPLRTCVDCGKEEFMTELYWIDYFCCEDCLSELTGKEKL